MPSTLIRLITAVLCCATATASAQLPSKALVDRRADELGTSGPSSRQARSVLVKGVGAGFSYPTLVVGVEKAPRDRIRDGEFGHHSEVELRILDELSGLTCGIPGAHPSPPERRCRNARKRLGQARQYFDPGKRTFVSHVLAWQGNGHPQPELLHSAYVDCGSPARADSELFDCAETPYENGWEALEKVGREIEHLLEEGDFTHLLLLVKGWNTSQTKSVEYFRSMPERIAKEAGDQPFRPLVVGLTWHSGWRWPLSGVPLLNAFPKALSYANKSKDADEIGLTWANVLLNAEIRPAAGDAGVPVILVGHSFGARILSRAAASAPLLGLQPGSDQTTLISLLGAFSMNRFLAERCEGVEGAPYWDLSQRISRLTLVWSRKDKLVPLANFVSGANHVGGHLGYRRASAYPERFTFRLWKEGLKDSERADVATREPCVSIDSPPPPVELIEAPMVEKHGHIDTPQMAALLWELIRDAEPTVGAPARSPALPAEATSSM